MRTVRLLEQAAEEAVEAAAWYEEQSPGLGHDFHQAVDAALDLLEEDILPLVPTSGAAGRRGAKRLLLHRFPYELVVAERKGDLVVVAIAHQARRPGYWRSRLRRI